MSQTRIICDQCGFPMVHCRCESNVDRPPLVPVAYPDGICNEAQPPPEATPSPALTQAVEAAARELWRGEFPWRASSNPSDHIRGIQSVFLQHVVPEWQRVQAELEEAKRALIDAREAKNRFKKTAMELAGENITETDKLWAQINTLRSQLAASVAGKAKEGQ